MEGTEEITRACNFSNLNVRDYVGELGADMRKYLNRS
jgi:hypothetical protein